MKSLPIAPNALALSLHAYSYSVISHPCIPRQSQATGPAHNLNHSTQHAKQVLSRKTSIAAFQQATRLIHSFSISTAETKRTQFSRNVDIVIYTMHACKLSSASQDFSLRGKNLIPERLLSELRQHESSLVHLLAVVPEKLVLLLSGPGANGLLDVDAAVFGAHHETDLAGGVGGDGGPAVLGDGEDFLALLLEAGDHAHVEPGVLGCEKVLLANRFWCGRGGARPRSLAAVEGGAYNLGW
jgi:hypothetical protein